MNCLFTRTILNWTDWGHIFQDINVWRPLIESIYAREHLTPGTNAVFKMGA